MTDALKKQEEEEINRENEKDIRKYNIGICAFSVLNVLMITLVAVTSFYICSEKRIKVLHDADICLPCEDLRLHPDDIIEGIERRGDETTICCAAKEEGSDVIIGYYIDHWLKEELAKADDRQFIRYKCDEGDSPDLLKPIIKLVGRNEKQSAGHHKLHWDGDHEMAIVPDDESIIHHKEHGFIEIKKSGLYHVYSQIVLDHDKNTYHHNHGPDIYQHSVILIEAEISHHISPRELILLKTSNTHCQCLVNRQTIKSYLGGAFLLSRGDKLAVKAHNKTEIVPVPHMNFFGAHMV